MSANVFTKDGGWTFAKVYDAICEQLQLPARQRIVYIELLRRATREYEKNRLITFGGFPEVLKPNQIHFKVAVTAIELGLSVGTFHRTLRELETRRVLRVVKRERGRSGGVIYQVAEPDEIPELWQLHRVRLENLRSQLSIRMITEKTPDLEKRWNRLNKHLEKWRRAASVQIEMPFLGNPPERGTGIGTVDALIHRSTALEAIGDQSKDSKEKDPDILKAEERRQMLGREFEKIAHSKTPSPLAEILGRLASRGSEK